MREQELYSLPADVGSYASTQENLNGVKGKGGLSKAGAKGMFQLYRAVYELNDYNVTVDGPQKGQ